MNLSQVLIEFEDLPEGTALTARQLLDIYNKDYQCADMDSDVYRRIMTGEYSGGIPALLAYFQTLVEMDILNLLSKKKKKNQIQTNDRFKLTPRWWKMDDYDKMQVVIELQNLDIERSKFRFNPM